VDRRLPEEEIMTHRRRTKFIHEGQYAAEVEVELIESQEGWAPYLSLEDAQKLDEVRAALRRGDLRRASQMARIFKLTPVAG
jgi:hypothetical protein